MGEPKQVIVIRKDLNMRKGKMISQGAHSSMAAILDLGFVDDHNLFCIPLSLALKSWILGKFTKITVSVDSEAELIAIYEKAKAAGIIAALITDSGATEFHGQPTKTAVAIGPDYPEKIDPITGHLKLL